MKKNIVVLALFLVGVLPTVAPAADTIARFQGGIGVLPVSGVAGAANADGTFSSVSRNTVRGVPPAGQPWVIADLNAVAKGDGSIKVDGRGLLLAGGNNIGLNANGPECSPP